LNRLQDARDGAPWSPVYDFTLKDEHGRFDRLIVAVGGVLGIGDVYVSVPYDEVQHTAGTRNLIWNVSKAQFHALAEKAKEARKSGAAQPLSAASAPKGAMALLMQSSQE
jgi:hypothetical protein